MGLALYDSSIIFIFLLFIDIVLCKPLPSIKGKSFTKAIKISNFILLKIKNIKQIKIFDNFCI